MFHKYMCTQCADWHTWRIKCTPAHTAHQVQTGTVHHAECASVCVHAWVGASALIMIDLKLMHMMELKLTRIHTTTSITTIHKPPPCTTTTTTTTHTVQVVVARTTTHARTVFVLVDRTLSCPCTRCRLLLHPTLQRCPYSWSYNPLQLGLSVN